MTQSWMMTTKSDSLLPRNARQRFPQTHLQHLILPPAQHAVTRQRHWMEHSCTTAAHTMQQHMRLTHCNHWRWRGQVKLIWIHVFLKHWTCWTVMARALFSIWKCWWIMDPLLWILCIINCSGISVRNVLKPGCWLDKPCVASEFIHRLSPTCRMPLGMQRNHCAPTSSRFV